MAPEAPYGNPAALDALFRILLAPRDEFERSHPPPSPGRLSADSPAPAAQPPEATGDAATPSRAPPVAAR